MGRIAPKKSFLNDEEAEQNDLPGFVPWSNPNELQATDRITRTTQDSGTSARSSAGRPDTNPGAETSTPRRLLPELIEQNKVHEKGDTKQPSMEISDLKKEHVTFALKDEEDIVMEEGVISEEWEKIEEAADGRVPGFDPNEWGVSNDNESSESTHGSSGGRQAESSLRGPNASPGEEAVGSRAHPPNNAQRRTYTFPPTRPGAVRVRGPGNEGLGEDEDEEQMTVVTQPGCDGEQGHDDDGLTIWDGNDEQATIPTRDEPTLNVIARAVDTEEEERIIREQDQLRRENDQFRHILENAPIVAPSDDPKCGPRGRRLFAISAILLIVGVVVVTVTLIVVLPSGPPTYYCGTTWDDAAIHCESAVQCPSGLDYECAPSGSDYECYAGISCGALAPTTPSPPPSTPSPTPPQ
jgi:hypothetical protein